MTVKIGLIMKAGEQTRLRSVNTFTGFWIVHCISAVFLNTNTLQKEAVCSIMSYVVSRCHWIPFLKRISVHMGCVKGASVKCQIQTCTN